MGLPVTLSGGSPLLKRWDTGGVEEEAGWGRVAELEEVRVSEDKLVEESNVEGER